MNDQINNDPKYHIQEEYKGVKELTSNDIEDLLPVLTKENKMFILNAIGFSVRGKGQWYHPALGDDMIFNRINFDVETDDLFMIINRIYHNGFKHGRHQIQGELKSLLNIRG